MAFTPDLTNVELEDCCIKSIKWINQSLTAGKWLQRFILPLGALMCFVGPSKGSSITTIYSIGSTNWENFAKATMAVPKWTRAECQKIAGIEMTNHYYGKINDFWTATYEAFMHP